VRRARPEIVGLIGLAAIYPLRAHGVQMEGWWRVFANRLAVSEKAK
jgi:hypothetical protein